MGNSFKKKEPNSEEDDPFKNVNTQKWENILSVALKMTHVTVVLLDENETQLQFDGPITLTQGALHRSISDTFGPRINRKVAKKLFTSVVNCSDYLESVSFRCGSRVWIFQKQYGVSELVDYIQILIDSELNLTELRLRELIHDNKLLCRIPSLVSRFHKSLRELEIDYVMEGLWGAIANCQNLSDLCVAYPEGKKPENLHNAFHGKYLKHLEFVSIDGLKARELTTALSTLAESPSYLRIVNCGDISLGRFLPLAPNSILENLTHLICDSGKLPLRRVNSPIRETAIEEENNALRLIPKLCPFIEEVGVVCTLALGLIHDYLDRYRLITHDRALIIHFSSHITLLEFAKEEGYRLKIRSHIRKAVDCEESMAIVHGDGNKTPSDIAKEWTQDTIDKFYRENVLKEPIYELENNEIREAVKFVKGSATVIGKFASPSTVPLVIENGTPTMQ